MNYDRKTLWLSALAMVVILLGGLAVTTVILDSGPDKTAKVDVTDATQIADAVRTLIAQAGRIDILINNAGYLGPLHAFDNHPEDDWNRIIQVNLIGMMTVAQLVLPHMRRQGRGCIVNMGSLAGKEGLARLAAYSAASAGIIAFTKALGREIADTGIRVNCVAPGPIDTDMIRGFDMAKASAESVAKAILDGVSEGIRAWLSSIERRCSRGLGRYRESP